MDHNSIITPYVEGLRYMMIVVIYLAFLASVRKDRPEVLGVGGGPVMLMSAPMVVYGQ